MRIPERLQYRTMSFGFVKKMETGVSEYNIKNSECEKLLGAKFDNKLTFEKHITDICRKASRKTYALARIVPYMDLSKRRMVMNAFFYPQFSYCSLICMCHIS